MPLRYDGHEAWTEATESGRRYRVGCSCGWPENVPGFNRGRTYATEVVATAAVVRHLTRGEMRQRELRRRSGLSPLDVDDAGTLAPGT